MAYVVVTIKKILDQKAFDEYAEKVRPTLHQHGGRWVAIEPDHVIKAGTWPYVRTVLVEFPSIEKAQQWYDSPEYREIIPLRQRAIDANIVMVKSLSEKE
jgi:uncharacterized protein (DUF1330 family)